MGTTRWLPAIAIVVAAVATMVVSAPAALADPADPAPIVPAETSPSITPPETSPSITPPEGVPHLPSPDNLPPGATKTAPEHRNLSYLREIWQAVRGQNITMSDALLLIAQRPMDTPNP